MHGELENRMAREFVQVCSSFSFVFHERWCKRWVGMRVVKTSAKFKVEWVRIPRNLQRVHFLLFFYFSLKTLFYRLPTELKGKTWFPSQKETQRQKSIKHNFSHPFQSFSLHLLPLIITRPSSELSHHLHPDKTIPGEKDNNFSHNFFLELIILCFYDFSCHHGISTNIDYQL